MNTFPSRLLLCAALVSLSTISAMAGGHGNHSSSSSGSSGARPAARSGAGPGSYSGTRYSGARSYSGARFSSAGVRHFNTAGNYNRAGTLNRNGVRWNSTAYRGANVVRAGNNVRSNANRSGQWNNNHHGQSANNHNWNGNHHGHWRHCGGNRYIFVWDSGFYPWFLPYSYYDSYYPYGAYQPAYGYDDGSDNAYGQQPVYQGNSVDESYAPADDQGASPDNVSILDVQRRLARAGFYKGPIDGAMGPRTFYAIRAYQRSHNLQVDGQIGPQLLNSLGQS